MREKPRDHQKGGDVPILLRLHHREEEIPAQGQLATDGREHHAMMVTGTNDIILIFGTSRVAYFCLTDLSGRLRRVFGAEPGNEEISVAVSEVQPRFEEEIGFWKT